MIRALVGVVLLLSATPALAQPYDWAIERGRHDGARILILRDYRLEPGRTARGPVIVIGGTATIDGEVLDDVVVIGGRLRVGPQAVVDGNLVTVGFEADIDPQARIRGEVHETTVQWPDIDGSWGPLPRGWLASVALAATLVRLFLIFVLAMAMTLVAPTWVQGMAARIGASPGVAAAVGLAGEVCFIPALVLAGIALLISIVGIPLIGALPLLVLAAGVVGTAGLAAVAARVGARVRGTSAERSSALLGDVVLGLTVIAGVSFVAHVAALGPLWMAPLAMAGGAAGYLIEYAAWTIGFGGALVSLFGGTATPRMQAVPPPIAPSPTTV